MDTFTTSDGLDLAYYIDDFTDPWAKAPTVLLLHAAMGSARRYFGWVPHLARHYRVVRLDLRGHGASRGAAGRGGADPRPAGARRRRAARSSRLRRGACRRQFGRAAISASNWR